MLYKVYYLCEDENPNTIHYIGVTKNVSERLIRHKYNAKSGIEVSHKANWIKSSISKGKKITLHVIYETDDIDDVYEKEIFYIKQYKEKGYKLYNVTDGGKGLRKKRTKTHQKKIDNAVKKYYKNNPTHKHSEETKKLLSEKHKGKKLKQSTKDKLGKSNQGEKCYFNKYKESDICEAKKLRATTDLTAKEISEKVNVPVRTLTSIFGLYQWATACPQYNNLMKKNGKPKEPFVRQKRKPLTDEEIYKIKFDRAVNQLNVEEIAEKYNCAHRTIRGIFYLERHVDVGVRFNETLKEMGIKHV